MRNSFLYWSRIILLFVPLWNHCVLYTRSGITETQYVTIIEESRGISLKATRLSNTRCKHL
ncbi:hypothetical protein CRYUN_Cryun09bG0106800 [Craigia yunnanensis]